MIKTAEFEGPGWHVPIRILVEKKTTLTSRDGFGAEPSIYPVTIVQARYGGTYEGGLGSCTWLCFPVSPDELSAPSWQDWEGSDIECMYWWKQADRDGWPIGRGASPDAAYADLIRIACEAAGADPADFRETPTWNRDELRERNDT